MTTSLITEGMIGGGSTDSNPPVATAVSPTPSTTPGAGGGMPADYASASVTPIVLTITDLDGQSDLALIVVTALYPGGGDVIFRDGAFEPSYSVGSVLASITDGYELTILNNSGWPGALVDQPNTSVKLFVDACDKGGNVIDVEFDYEMPLAPTPAPPPGPPAPIPSPIPTSSPVYIDHVEAAIDRLPLQFRKP